MYLLHFYATVYHDAETLRKEKMEEKTSAQSNEKNHPHKLLKFANLDI